MYWIPFKDVD